MSIRIADFNGYDKGAIIYESVSMTAFSPMFDNWEDAEQFLQWVAKKDDTLFILCDEGKPNKLYIEWLKENGRYVA